MLEVGHVSSGYGAVNVLKDVSLSVSAGETVGLVGANGAGKTTLVLTLAGLLATRSGRITLNGNDLSGVPAHRRPGVGLGIVLERRNLFGELTVRENLRLAERTGAARKRKFDLDRIIGLFPRVGEKLSVRCELLSGGEQQMVAIARTLLLQPDIVVMDEPSTGLAPKVVKDILEVLGQLRGEGMSFVLIEQNIAIASTVTSRAYVMSTGRIAHEIGEGGWPEFLRDEKLVKAYLGQH
jgi:ABC-type branched-subunit amino acid transport system ATPase component